MPKYKNVLEEWTYFDTVLITNGLANLAKQATGWCDSFADFGALNEVNFFNVRNKATAGEQYCNMETRDQTSVPLWVDGINVHFFAPSAAYQIMINQAAFKRYEVLHSALWTVEFPRHFGLQLNVNVDERLAINCEMACSGCGPIVTGYGSLGSAPIGGATAATGGIGAVAGVQGDARRKAFYPFTVPIAIPKACNLSVVLKPSEYVRQFLTNMLGPFNVEFLNSSSAIAAFPAVYGIRVSLHGTRAAQQRGELHR